MPTGNHEPLNQVRLTNVAVVRLSRGGHRFEVACYRNKIVNYRQGTETDLSEVLQTERVFTNVSRGEFANKKILQKVFGTSDETQVCKLVLDEGDVQVSDMERSARLESTAREVASMVSERCVHPDSRRPYTVTQVRDAMRIAGFMVHPTHGAKQQFLDCVKLLRRSGALDVERAKMELALVLLSVNDEGNSVGIEGEDQARRRENFIELLIKTGVDASDINPPPSGNNDENDNNGSSRIVFQSDPSLYRKLDDIAKDPSVRVRLEIVHQCVIEEGEVTIGSEIERRDRRRLQGEQQQKHNHHDDDVTTLENVEQHTDDFGDGPLTNLSNLAIEDDDDENSDDESPSHLGTTGGTATATFTSRKAQKAAQKKSKKAKRREKEENVDREVRVEAEKARQRERADRLGIVDDTSSAITTNASSHTHPYSSIDGTAIERSDPVASTTCASSLKPCNTCGGAFMPGEYRLHFRSDWHRYNVKLKLKGVAAVSEREFLLCDSDIFFE